MRRTQPTRREIFESCIVRGFLVAGVPMSASTLLAQWQKGQSQASKPTPTEVLGPFYKKGAPNASTLRAAGDPGFPLRVSGKVFDTRGEPVPGARLDIWQADHAGHYDVQGYRYRTKLRVEASSEYAIDTVMPGHYSDRPAQHIHYMISRARTWDALITQVYFATDPFFEGDPDKNYNKRSICENRDLVRPVMLFEEPGAHHAAVNFDICLERA